ncbi:MAG TPA: DNA mismatch repair endonuclease MutL, partial [Saprospiraceae bacterium]|nr:DNA mismatch repair endonuclease MutL [Saprospiraceae bacterium]
MPDIIRLLPDSIANQIAAGEVIQRPASVVKELVENAIDAGSTQIKLVVKDAGKTLIQVIDNGKGMTETDARMSFERHATSKITSANDLFSIKTLGFRGEALASIAAIAHVELISRTSDEEVGHRLVNEGSTIIKSEKVQAMQGTMITVKNLFYNV